MNSSFINIIKSSIQLINSFKKMSMIKNTSIKVGIKIKPSPAGSKQTIVTSMLNQGQPPRVILNIDNNKKEFQVDAIHDANNSKSTMFQDLHIDRFVQKFVNGFNVTIMAYGHTGAGKTYCMQGRQNQPGIIIDSIRNMYEKIKPQATVSCSYIQLYNQKIFDLLVDDATNNQNLKLRWQIQRDFIVEDLSTHIAKTAKDMQKLWRKGTKNRVVASNKIHDMSSRSHALFTMSIHDKDEENNNRFRQMTFVDLAGSERLFDHIGRLSKQSIQINKSLFVLRKVIKILQQATTQNKQMYVPYRDSKLTSILKGALGGNCLTMMIACIDSLQQQRQQTLLTLSYAISTGRIQNSARVNIDTQALENKQLKHQNQKLKKQLQSAWRQIDLLHRRQKSDAQKKSMTQYSHKVIQCIGTIRQLIKSNKQLREQLDQQRKIKRQQKLEIQMLMQERLMAKKYSSLNQSPRRLQASMNVNNFQGQGESPTNKKDIYGSMAQMPVVNEKQQVAPHKIIRIRQILGPSSSISPQKSRNNNDASGRKLNNTVTKRKKYTVHKTQPDQILQYRAPRMQKKQSSNIKK